MPLATLKGDVVRAFQGIFRTLVVAGDATVQQLRAQRVVDQATGARLNAGGTIAFNRVTANQGPTAPPFDITGLSRAVTLVSGRRYRISAQTLITSSVATDGVQLAIVEDATDIMLTNEVIPGAAPGASGSNRASVVRVCPGDVTAGSHTYKLSARRNGGGTGNFTNNAAATFPSWMLIEDIGA